MSSKPVLAMVTTCLLVAAASCGSVGGDAKDAGGSGGSGTGSGGSAAGGSGVGGTGGSGAGGAQTDAAPDSPAATDGSTDRAEGGGGDAAVDAGPVLASCQEIKQRNPAAASDVYTIAPPGFPARTVFCEMTLDGGGWTAFYIGDNGSAPGGAHFETTADACPDVRNRCLRRVPASVTIANDFAVKCGAAVVKFKLNAAALSYFRDGVQGAWQPLTGAITIDTTLVGKGNLVATVWTGTDTVNNPGWIVAGPDAPAGGNNQTTFANGYTPNPNFNFCNGTPDATMRVMLFYR